MLVEVCANSLQSAINAQEAGANRIELCSELAVGGITPSYGLLKAVRQKVSIPIHILIRPRSGDFTYSEEEIKMMQQNIELCIDLGFEGIVSGVLFSDFRVDLKRTQQLIKSAGNLHFTFHRAFDWVVNPLEVLPELEAIGVETILSSGQQNSALEGIELLKVLNEKSASVTIMPGGGIRNNNIEVFKKAGFSAAHLSGTKFSKTLPSPPKVSMNSSSFLKDDEIAISDLDSIRQIVKVVK